MACFQKHNPLASEDTAPTTRPGSDMPNSQPKTLLSEGRLRRPLDRGDARIDVIDLRPVATDSGLRCRAAELADYDQIAALQARNGLEAKSRDEWKALWLCNPAYERQRGWPMGWVLEGGDGLVSGYFGNIPLAYEFQGRKLTAASGYSLVADEDYRGFALSLVRRFVEQPGADLIIDSSCNAYSAPIHEAMRFSRVPIGCWDRSQFWITNFSGFAESVLRKKNIPRAFAPAVASALWARQALSRAPERHCDLEVLSAFDERFDTFWTDTRFRRSRELLADRSSANLNWHFRRSLASGDAQIVAYSRGANLHSYAIFLRQDSDGFDLKRSRLVDFQSLSFEPNVLESVLAWGLDYYKNRGLDMLETFGLHPDKQSVLEKFSAFKRSLPAWLFYYKTSNIDLDRRLADPRVWDPSLFDGDISL